MSDHGAEEGDCPDTNAPVVPYLYAKPGKRVPRKVTHLRVRSTIKIIDEQAFCNYQGLREVELTEGIEQIQERAFAGLKFLEKVSIPSTVKTISRGAFYNCRRLEAVTLSEGLERIEDSAFERCVSLKKISIPSSVKVISNKTLISGGAFQGCKRLEELKLCEGLERIGDDAFSECISLRSVTIPSTVRVISSGAFDSCKALESVEASEGLELIERNAFEKCKSLKSFYVPSSVRVLSSRAFKHCKQLVDVKLCEGLKQIEERAFEGCDSLRHITIPGSTRVVMGHTFQNCKQLESVELCEGVEELHPLSFRSGCELLRYQTAVRVIKIPSTVTVLPKGIFSEFIHLEKVEVGNGRLGIRAMEIRSQAFWKCLSLKEIRFSASVKSVGIEAFAGCTQLREVSFLNGPEQIAQSSFEHCSSLSCIRMAGAKWISRCAFKSCKQLATVDLQEGLEGIDPCSFMFCNSINRIMMPTSVRAIGSKAFQGCQQLMSIELKSIAMTDFQQCPSLRNLALQPDTPRCSFVGCFDLIDLFGTHEHIFVSLKSRFVGLPTHKLCYYQSFDPCKKMTEQLLLQRVASEGIFGNGRTQDCLGMTPLHILTLSTKHHLEIYQLLIAQHPMSLITEDRWGCLPIFYSILGNSPAGVIQLLIHSLKSTFPDFTLNWDKMIETLSRIGASPEVILKFLDCQRVHFPDSNIDAQKCAKELNICCLVRCDSFEDFSSIWRGMVEAFGASKGHHKIVQGLLNLERELFPNQNIKVVQKALEQLCAPLEGWLAPALPHHSLAAFRFFAKCRIPERSKTGVRKWQRTVIKVMAKRISEKNSSGLTSYFHAIHSQLLSCEREFDRLKEAMFCLELALWKAKITQEEGHQEIGDNGKIIRGPGFVFARLLRAPSSLDKIRQCRVNCGADVIIPNVLLFLSR